MYMLIKNEMKCIGAEATLLHQPESLRSWNLGSGNASVPKAIFGTPLA